MYDDPCRSGNKPPVLALILKLLQVLQAKASACGSAALGQLPQRIAVKHTPHADCEHAGSFLAWFS